MSKKTLYITLSIPPSVNSAYITRSKSYGRFMRPSARAWCDDATEKIINEVYIQNWETLSAKTVVEMTFYFKDKRIRDTNNCLKLLCDVLEDGGVYSNDYYCLPRVNNFFIDKNNPRLELTIYKLEE